MKRMTLDTEKMRRLTGRYLAGEITAKEECELFNFVTSDPEHSQMFAQWRQQWNDSPAQDTATNEGWDRLRSRIHMQILMRSRKPRRTLIGWQIAAATLIVCATFFGARQYDMRLLSRMTESYAIATQIGDRSTVNLPDGTQVRLQETSKLTYPINFNTTNRTVNLSGSAYFDVAHDRKHRFEVKIGDCSIVVKGTKFDVSAYDNTSFITTTLLEGSIDFTMPIGSTTLTPGESLSYDKTTKTVSVSHIDTALYQAWVDGRAEFVNVTIDKLCDNLRKLYGVNITLDDRLKTNNTSITLRLNNQESLDKVLKALGLIIPISVDRHGHTLHISAK